MMMVMTFIEANPTNRKTSNVSRVLCYHLKKSKQYSLFRRIDNSYTQFVNSRKNIVWTKEYD